MTAPRGVPAGSGRRLWIDCDRCRCTGRLREWEQGPNAWHTGLCPDCGGRGVVAIERAELRVVIDRALSDCFDLGVYSPVRVADYLTDALTEGTDA